MNSSDWCRWCFGRYFMCQFNWKYCACFCRGYIWENPYCWWGGDDPSCDGYMGNRKTGMQTSYSNMFPHIGLRNLLDELPNVNKGKSEVMSSSGGCMCLPAVSLWFADTSLTYRATMPFVQCCGKKCGHLLPVTKLHWAMPCSEQATYS